VISIFKRGTVWWAYSHFSGTRRRWSLHTRDKDAAKALQERGARLVRSLNYR